MNIADRVVCFALTAIMALAAFELDNAHAESSAGETVPYSSFRDTRISLATTGST